MLPKLFKHKILKILYTSSKKTCSPKFPIFSTGKMSSDFPPLHNIYFECEKLCLTKYFSKTENTAQEGGFFQHCPKFSDFSVRKTEKSLGGEMLLPHPQHLCFYSPCLHISRPVPFWPGHGCSSLHHYLIHATVIPRGVRQQT